MCRIMASTMSALGSTFSGKSIAFRAAPVSRAAARPVVTVEAKRICQLTGGCQRDVIRLLEAAAVCICVANHRGEAPVAWS